jgi:hypothetical protein
MRSSKYPYVDWVRAMGWVCFDVDVKTHKWHRDQEIHKADEMQSSEVKLRLAAFYSIVDPHLYASKE